MRAVTSEGGDGPQVESGHGQDRVVVAFLTAVKG
jgi:hypothetical protein